LAHPASPLVNHARNTNGTAQLSGAVAGSGKNPPVEVFAAYLNPGDQIQRLRAALAELHAPGAPPDGAYLTTASTK
jgi:hypothetical protein